MQDVNLSEKAKQLAPGLYEHFRGKRYRVFGVGFSEKTLEEMVVYQALYGDNHLWIRAIDSFCEEVMTEQGAMQRFRKIESE